MVNHVFPLGVRGPAGRWPLSGLTEIHRGFTAAFWKPQVDFQNPQGMFSSR